jgi:hypothetical protein
LIHMQMVIFYAPKHGNDESEWEDGGAGFPGDPTLGHGPRFAVADGATQGFGSARWAQQLVAGFVGADRAVRPPALSSPALGEWFESMQVRWRHDPRLAGASELQLIKLEEVGSLATFLGCEITGLDGSRPRWNAVALGDTVLFHVRDHRLVAQFPRIAAEDFGFNPDGVHTKPEAIAGMLDRLLVGMGELADGDLLYVATDAFAQWMVEAIGRDHRSLWNVLAQVDHPDTFRTLVADRRRAGEMNNDDVTLLRARVVTAQPAYLVVCI